MVDETILSLEDHDHFLTHGYVVVQNAVPPEVIERAVAELEAEDPDPEFDPAASCTTDIVFQVLTELFGPEYPFAKKRGGSDMARPRKDDVEWALPPAHVDDAYPTLMPNNWAVGTFIFLTRVHSRGGAFIYFSGSPLRYRQGMARSYHSIKEVAAAVHFSGPAEEFLAEPGDVLFFHHLMGHTGSDNVADPQTRHALLARWVPLDKRIVPGDKPFEQMSTIEKANSARYLEHRFEVDLGVVTTPVDEESAAVLREGFAGLGRVRAYALLHFDGRAQLLAVSEEDPTRIRCWQSDDRVHWVECASLLRPTGVVRALHLHQYGFAAILAITGEDGRARVYSSLDFAQWEPVADLDRCRSVTPYYVYANYPSKIAADQAIYVVSEDDPAQASCRWGAEWLDAAEGSDESVAVRAPADGRIEDLIIAAYYSDSNCAFVADVVFDGCESSLPYYILPRDVAVAEGELQPLAYEGSEAPRRVRIFNRGPSFWLVVFARGAEDRLFWGAIDWEQSPPTLRTLSDAAALDEAQRIVGMI